MKKLILISLVILFTICSRSWALPECEGSPAYAKLQVQWNNCVGTFQWKNGHKYIGEFKNSKLNGKGTFHFKSGQKYIGEFKDHKRHGKGVMYYINGKIKYSGEWINDKTINQINSEKRAEIKKLKEEKRNEKQRIEKEKIKNQQRLAEENKRREQRRLHQIMVDKCIIKIYEKNDKWDIEDVDYLCNNLIYNDIPENLLSDNEGPINKNIYNNCLTYNGLNRTRRIIKSAINVCAEASINPTLANKTKYKFVLPRFKFLEKLLP